MTPFKLLHFSDPHFGACDPAIAQAASLAAHKIEPDHLVVSGDLSMRGRRRELQAAAAWLQHLPQPLTVFPGNHDVPGLNQPLDRFFAPFRRYRKYINAVEEPTAPLGKIGTLVTANSSTPFGWHRDWSRGFLGPIQGNRIHREFSGTSGLRILGIHHPLLASKTKARALVSPLPLVRNLLHESKVDLVLAGHFHQSKVGLFPGDETAVSNTIVSQAPSVCTTRLKGEPNGYHLIHLTPDSILIQVFRWRGTRFERFSENSFSRSSLGWVGD
ncbi:MAG: metallophosphoesterase family protein [Verrucomicrobiaceae bacterium]